MKRVLKSTKSSRPVGVDLFAGAGGMSLGFEQAGFNVAAAVEIDPIHCCIHKFNFPKCTVIPHSVEDVTGNTIRKIAGIEGKVDVVFGGAPCQGFSMIGKRILDDPRNSLVRDFVRIVSELDADYFVFENVKGLTVGSHKKFLEELIETFDAAGYAVRLPWMVLNAASYGVPQDRKRLFLLGAKKGLKPPCYPPPITTKAGRPHEIGLTQGPSCMDALDDLPDADEFPALLNSDEVKPPRWRKVSSYASEMRCLNDAAWHFGEMRLWNPRLLTSSTRTGHSEISKLRFNETMPGAVEPISRFFKLSSDGASNTLRAGTDSARGAFTSPRPIHYRHPRCVTVREMARLHGFPDWFRFHHTKWHGARQIGNAVPPPLARAVAASLITAMGINPQCGQVPIPLGDPKLLYADMSQASTYWDVSVPIQKRDRKSGARKRTQTETEAQRLGNVTLKSA
ncbi:MAG: DNA cytosine methyltransferase [Luteolibacter sp.]|uniref:DNA cytosine methyltransferase n=1 Tax=Luteolibacter sp. TaxID=1962973 RepID=UPI003263F52C